MLRLRLSFLFPLLLLLLSKPIGAQQKSEAIGNLLSERDNLTLPARRSQTVEELSQIERREKADAVSLARKLNLPVRIERKDGGLQELMAFENGKPLYAVTLNREAAITTTANSARTLFEIDGTGFTVGVWDAGAARATHEAFEGRVLVRDGASVHTHATHVAGTIGASGNTIRAHGMSSGVHIDSYDWNNDRSEMLERGASYPGEPDTIYLSNHSYGYISGWDRSGGATDWTWHGDGTTNSASEPDFGRYNNFAREVDALLFNLSYLLPFWAAGNDRDQNPSEGSSVKIGSRTDSYKSAQHPPGDGVYKNGYDTTSYEAVAKNVMSVGAVADAVTAGHRDLSKATMPAFSAWGPTDDGRIKPDIVANGVSLYSTRSASDSSYGTSTGTSMATANATGSAQLLVSYFDRLFPGHAMRASTLKALIIHTADDLGTPGPDYIYGWGLMNTKQAIHQIEAYHTNSGGHGIVEAELFSGQTEADVQIHSFTWDGISPIRATLAWTDPAGSSTSAHDNRSSRLVNDLDLQIIGPDDQIYEPFVMPYVDDWSESSLSAPATTGVNSTDNVEQVYIDSPATPGTWLAVVQTLKPLANGSQIYSLILSGTDSVNAPAPTITEISPDSATNDSAIVALSGSHFQIGANVRFEFPGETPRAAFGHEITIDRITARLDTGGMKNGFWDVVVTNTDGKETVFPSAFAVGGSIWKENFDAMTEPWESDSSSGPSTWTIADDRSVSSPDSYHATGSEMNGIDDLYSPVITIPEGAEDLEFRFEHRHFFSYNHGGVIEFSIDDGPWLDLDSTTSGAEFQSGDYNNIFSAYGPLAYRNPLGGRSNWSGDQTAFSSVVIGLDSEIYAGRELRVRWRVATDGYLPSAGWWIDDVLLSGSAVTVLPSPKITTGPAAAPSVVVNSTTQLSVSAEDRENSALTYTWRTKAPIPAPVQFSQNGDENSAATSVTFTAAGAYLFEVAVRNSTNAIVTGSIPVEVLQTPTELALTPPTVSVPTGGTFTFAAELLDQFSFPLETQPPLFWTIELAAGEISNQGIFAATIDPGGPFTLSTSDGNQWSATAEVFVHEAQFADWQNDYFSSNELADPNTSDAAADPDGDGLPNLLEYALGSDPTIADPNGLPKTEFDETDLVLTFSRPIGRTDIIYSVERSHDLEEWISIAPELWETIGHNDRVEVRVRHPLEMSQILFLRLRVEMQE